MFERVRVLLTNYAKIGSMNVVRMTITASLGHLSKIIGSNNSSIVNFARGPGVGSRNKEK